MQAAQITFEDYFMADLEVAPLKIVGWEGVFGTLIMALVLLPIVYFVPGEDGRGFHENSIETLHVRALAPMQPVMHAAEPPARAAGMSRQSALRHASSVQLTMRGCCALGLHVSGLIRWQHR